MCGKAEATRTEYRCAQLGEQGERKEYAVLGTGYIIWCE